MFVSMGWCLIRQQNQSSSLLVLLKPPTRAMQNKTYENDISDGKVEMVNKTPEEKHVKMCIGYINEKHKLLISRYWA